MNKRKLYESIMSSVAKEVKKVLNEGRKRKKEFSKKDLKELKEFMLEDEDFYACYCNNANINYYSSYEESIDDFIDFLENGIEDIYDDPDFEGIHAWYILDEPDIGCSWAELNSGRLANIDNLYTEYKSVISSM